MTGWLLVASAFLASAVEMVEALTIILAAGVTRGWRSALAGAGAATVALGGLIYGFGQAIELIPIDALRLLIGTLLLIFGLQWLRKAILRAAGWMAIHDETAVYAHEVRTLRADRPIGAGLIDGLGFTVAFKGVLLEGLEVAFICVTFGSSTPNGIQTAALGAGLALALVATAGLVVHRPLARVPENSLKFAVGLMLTAFGTFWAAEGIGVEWPGRDLAILALLGVYTAAGLAAVLLLRHTPIRLRSPA